MLRGVDVLFVVAFVVAGIQLGSTLGTDEQWLRNLRPAMLPVYMKKTSHHNAKPDPTKYFDRHLGMFDIIRKFLREHADEIEPDMIDLMRAEMGNGPQTDALTCYSEVQCPPPASKVNPVASYRRAVDSLLNEPSSCAPCQVLFDNLRDNACTKPWEEMRDNIINLCEDLLFPIIGLDPVMCNGSITLQGPHLYCMIKEATSFEMCESLNQCYPAEPATKQTVPAMSERIPPAIKARKSLKSGAKTQKKRKPKVKRQSGRVRIVQLTDIHVQPEYSIGSPVDCRAAVCCLEDSLARDGTSYARKWGEYTCNLPERTLVKFLEKVNTFNPDFVIYAGDSPPHTVWEETLTSQLNISNIVVNAMKTHLTPGTTVYPTIGNHEMYPTNLYSYRLSETAQMSDSFTRMWHSLARLDSQANATFSDMSYYSVLNRPGLRILSLNTNYDWYTANFYSTVNKNHSSNDDHKQFVENTLANARAMGEKVIVISHHPVGGAVVRAGRWWHDVMMQYGDVIALHVSGHTHVDEFHVMVDPLTDEAKAVNLVAPTVTTNTNINPSLRLFELDDTTFELLDYQCHFFEIDQQNPDADPEIVLNYDPRVDYNMTDLSPSGWLDLALRFLDDEALFQLWYANRHAMATQGPCALDGVCSDSCKRARICEIIWPVEDEQAACVANWDNITLPGMPASIYSSAPSTDVTGLVMAALTLLAVISIK